MDSNVTTINVTVYNAGLVDYGIVCIEIMLMFVTCGGNLLVMIVFGENQRFRQPKNFYIVQLAIADFTVGLSMSYQAVTLLYPVVVRNIHLCLLKYSFSMLGMAVSVISLVSLTVDRFLAMNWPLTYQQTVSPSRQILTALFIWIVALSCVFTPVMLIHHGWSKTFDGDCDLVMVVHNDFLSLVTPLFIVISGGIVLALYARILLIAYRHTMAIRTLDVTTQTNSHKREFRAAKTTAVVLGIFYGCWGPFTISTCLQIVLVKQRDPTWKGIRRVMTMLPITNSAINPFIYAHRMPEVRERFKTMLTIKRSKIEQSSIISTMSTTSTI